MKHYPHHIGDFDRATRHLTRIERSVYRDLIDMYYDTERQLPLDRALVCRKILARCDEESTAVEQVLNEFFTETPTGWHHQRCEAEIDAYRANTSQKALAGRASVAAKAAKKQRALSGLLTAVERTLNSVATSGNGVLINKEPITNNQGTDTSYQLSRKREPKKLTLEKPEDVEQKLWDEWCAHRRQKKSQVSDGVLSSLRSQAGLVPCTLSAAMREQIDRGWAGFKAEWMQNDRARSAQGLSRSFGKPSMDEIMAKNRAAADEFVALSATPVIVQPTDNTAW